MIAATDAVAALLECTRNARSCHRVKAVFDCDWSLSNHGVANIKRMNLGNLNPIYENLTKLGVYHEVEGS